MNLSRVDVTSHQELKPAIKEWICAYVAQLADMPKERVDVNVEFSDYGLDSTAAAGLSGDLSDWLGIHLEVNIAKKYRTAELLSEEVFSLVSTRQV
jgi:acyl carrier protein